MSICSRDFIRTAALVFAFAPAAYATNPIATDTTGLRELGVQIKAAVDQATAGDAPDAESLKQFEYRLARFCDAVGNARDAQQYKSQAIALLFGKLRYLAAHPKLISTKPTPAARADIDIEALTDRHGSTCTTALGISAALPVKITLAETGKGQSDAWFRFEAGVSRHIRIQTDSQGPDPSIQAYRSCATGSTAIASNDDSLGLDASLSLASMNGSPLFIHVTNSGSGGTLVASVLDTTAAIEGTITDAATSQPVSNVTISLYDSNGNLTGASGFTDQNGGYSVPVDPGSYYVRASTGQYVSEVYPTAHCAYHSSFYDLGDCSLAQAQSVVVASGATVANIDMALDSGQQISGVVRDDSSNPLGSATVTLYDGAGNALNTDFSDGFGRYSFTTLTPATYKLGVQAGGFGAQMFDHVACAGPLENQCDLNNATPINISNQDITANFGLPPLAAIRGNLSGPGFSPLTSSAQVVVLDAYGNVAAQTNVDSSGDYRAGPLAIGNYEVYATATGFFSQLFNGVDCVQDCFSSLTSGSTIAITQNGQVPQADFRLTPVPEVHGHVQDAISGLPIANALVLASTTPPASFNAASSTATDSRGDYTLTGTPAGKYYVWTQSNNYIDQVYSGIACEALPNYYPNYAPCEVVGATLLNISPGFTPGPFNFALQPASTIRGQAVVRAGAGSDLPAVVGISIFDGSGIVVRSANTDSLGNYAVSDLAPGTYFASAGSFTSSFVTQVWQMIDCPSTCAATAGTPVVVGQNTTVPSIDFMLTRRDAIVGQVTDSASGAPLAGVIVDLFDASNNAYQTSAVSDARGYYAAAGNQGNSYLVATEATPGFVDQIFSGISCPVGPAFFGLCSLTNAMPIGLSFNGSQPHIVNFALQRQNEIFANGFDP